MTVHAKEIINGKFWILEDEGEKIATLSLADDKFLLADRKGTRFFDNTVSVETDFGKQIVWENLEIVEHHFNEVHGYQASVKPYNAMYNIQKKLPLFTKSENSKSIYCAGYYIIKFDKGWVKSYCPKLITLEKYQYEGPFKNKIEMRSALANKNAK